MVIFIRRWSVVFIAAVLAAGALAVRQTLWADPATDSRSALSEGNRLLKEGQFDEARQCYQSVIATFREASPEQRRQLFTVNRVAAHSLKIFDLLKEVEGAVFRDGVYTGTADGYKGPVGVRVTVADGRISAIEITRTNEDRPRDALTVIPRRIVAEQSVLVDAVTGATVTSNAVREAAANALRLALQND